MENSNQTESQFFKKRTTQFFALVVVLLVVLWLLDNGNKSVPLNQIKIHTEFSQIKAITENLIDRDGTYPQDLCNSDDYIKNNIINIQTLIANPLDLVCKESIDNRNFVIFARVLDKSELKDNSTLDGECIDSYGGSGQVQFDAQKNSNNFSCVDTQ